MTRLKENLSEIKRQKSQREEELDNVQGELKCERAEKHRLHTEVCELLKPPNK